LCYLFKIPSKRIGYISPNRFDNPENFLKFQLENYSVLVMIERRNTRYFLYAEVTGSLWKGGCNTKQWVRFAAAVKRVERPNQRQDPHVVSSWSGSRCQNAFCVCPAEKKTGR